MKSSRQQIELIREAVNGLTVREHNTTIKLDFNAMDIKDIKERVGHLATSLIDLEARVKAVESTSETTSETIRELTARVTSLEDEVVNLLRDRSAKDTKIEDLRTEVDDQAKALDHLSTRMEKVVKALTCLDGWMSNVEGILDAFRK